MKWSDVAIILSKIGVDPDPGRVASGVPKGRVHISCPMAPWFHKGGTDHRPSCSVWFGPAVVTNYYCYGCDNSGSLSRLIEAVAGLVQIEDAERARALMAFAQEVAVNDRPSLAALVEDAAVGLDEFVLSSAGEDSVRISEEWLRGHPVALSVPAAVEYLQKTRVNMVPDSLIRQFQLRYDRERDRVVFPVRDNSGKLVGAVGRSVLAECDTPYYNYFEYSKSLSLFGSHLVPERPGLMLLVEGVFDVLRLFRPMAEKNVGVVASLSADLSTIQAERLVDFEASIAVAYDAGEAGDIGSKKAIARLKNLVFGHVWRLRPPGDLDPDEMDDAQIRCFIERLVK